MAVRPKVRSSNGMSQSPTDELSCGYVMHQYKSIRCKMRWGQLRTGDNDDGVRRCTIRLYKYDIVNPKPGTFTKKDLKEKVCFEFTEEDFCGLEKGEHYTRNGMRRYVCIILRNKHLIVQDAITAMTDTDHDVIGSWYRNISQTMHYVNRWKIFQENPVNSDIKFLHMSRTNLCDCYSLHNSAVGQKGKILLDNLWKTGNLRCIDEADFSKDGNSFSRITFYDARTDVKISLVLHGVVKLSMILSEVQGKRNGIQRSTLCPKFDDLKLNPNLIKMPRIIPEPKQPPLLNLRQLSSKNRIKSDNPYIISDQCNENTPPVGDPMTQISNIHAVPNSSVHEATTGSVACPSPNQMQNNAPVQGTGSPIDRPNASLLPVRPNMMRSANGLPPRHHANRTHTPPPRPPRDPQDDQDMQKKQPDLATQTSFDSDYQTGEHLTTDSFSTYSRFVLEAEQPQTATRVVNTTKGHYQLENQNGPYMNILGQSTISGMNPNENQGTALGEQVIGNESLHPQLDNDNPSYEIPPLVPKRDHGTMEGQSAETENDLVERAIQLQQLAPIDTNPDSFRPGYENSLNIEVTIGEILSGNHRETEAGNLGLPYSVYLSLVLGLEKDSLSHGSWRALASALQMSFRDVELIESAVHSHPQLLPAQILLLHWQRTQAPYPFSRFHLRSILVTPMGRFDLAGLIDCDEATDNKSVEGDEDKAEK